MKKVKNIKCIHKSIHKYEYFEMYSNTNSLLSHKSIRIRIHRKVYSNTSEYDMNTPGLLSTFFIALMKLLLTFFGKTHYQELPNVLYNKRSW